MSETRKQLEYSFSLSECGAYILLKFLAFVHPEHRGSRTGRAETALLSRNGIKIQSVHSPAYYREDKCLCLPGARPYQDGDLVTIPASDWGEVKECLEAYKLMFFSTEPEQTKEEELLEGLDFGCVAMEMKKIVKRILERGKQVLGKRSLKWVASLSTNGEKVDLEFTEYSHPLRGKSSSRFKASNGVKVESCTVPEFCNWVHKEVFLPGTDRTRDGKVVSLPVEHWPKVLAALNEYVESFKKDPAIDEIFEDVSLDGFEPQARILVTRLLAKLDGKG